MSPPYRVMLHNDNHNKREYVVQVLMKVIPGMTLDNAVNIMQEAHINDLAVVIICAQADAEEHCMQLRGNGLLSSIEPASDEGLDIAVDLKECYKIWGETCKSQLLDEICNNEFHTPEVCCGVIVTKSISWECYNAIVDDLAHSMASTNFLYCNS
ncbi:hypothetical protein SASPL_129246 [Salvia splendens]|uniref:Adaptor protein ClpS core domain-containing protein n=1 Tax=Salvia splendens TaxID=180675 RepID=A0A8X8XE46_SALSN|nr:hypothetical protein SASPL_129246 [Salvia splendens]